MDSQASTDTKQITIDVPAERLAEFYAFFGRFLAGGPGRGRRGRHDHGGPGHRGHHCGHRADPETEPPTASEAPAGTTSL